MRALLVASLCVLMCTCVLATSDAYFRIADDLLAGKDYYAILGVSDNATMSEIRRSYRKLSVK
jgi:preprotein translocase subunit Sec63